MSLPTVFGFLGDSLTFIGAAILALDALLREREFDKQRQMQKMIKTLTQVRLTLRGIELVDDDSAALVYIRQSVHRAIWGGAILTVGFLSLFAARVLEFLDRPNICP